MKIKYFHFVVFSLLIIFAVISFGGCGGSSSSFNGGSGSNNNGGGGGSSNVGYSVLEFNNIDTDTDGTIDILDFSDVEEKYYDEDEIITDRKISVPSRHHLDRFKSDVESPDSFVVDLTAGTEYTVEISKGFNYNYPIAESIPNVEIINPQGNALSFIDLGTFDESYDSEAIIELPDDMIELSVYPPDEPYAICFTFTPATTGSYKINLKQIISDDDYDNVKTLFVYKELRNDDTGEAGYYKRFKFKDADGNVSETISMTDIMELRKAYTSTVSKLFGIYLEFVISGDIEWNDNDLVEIQEYGLDVYDSALHNIRQRYGLFDVEVDNDKAAEGSSGTKVSSSASTKTVNGKTIEEGKLNVDGTSLPSQLVGIPYTDAFLRGTGFFGVTGIQASGRAIQGFTLPVPKKASKRARYTARFVSSQEERNKLAKTNADASLQLGGFGLKAGYSESNSFKFGLTSATFVIHYEETEAEYRCLEDDDDYQLRTAAQNILNNNGSNSFRTAFGDYFVAGYKYGGTYDAFISVTTQTTEDLAEVKAYLQANYNSQGKAASADIGRQTSDFLKKKNALVTVEIRTAGIDTDNNVSGTASSDVTDIASQLQTFRAKLKESSPEDYLPCYVMLKRYRSLTPVLLKMLEEGDEAGLIPIKAQHSSEIMDFNNDYLIMESYYNVIADLSTEQINLESKNALAREVTSINNEIQSYGNSFYADSNASRMQDVHKKIKNLSTRLKALGDRYSFYCVLMRLQADEKTKTQQAVSDGKINMDYLPYGRGGGNIGIQSYNVSTAVTSDLNAGKWQNDSVYSYNAVSRGIYDKTFEAGEGYIFCYLEVTAPLGTWDYERQAQFPTVASNTAKYHFEAAPVTYSNWKFKLKTMRFNSSLYPFRGLTD